MTVSARRSPRFGHARRSALRDSRVMRFRWLSVMADRWASRAAVMVFLSVVSMPVTLLTRLAVVKGERGRPFRWPRRLGRRLAPARHPSARDRVGRGRMLDP